MFETSEISSDHRFSRMLRELNVPTLSYPSQGENHFTNGHKNLTNHI